MCAASGETVRVTSLRTSQVRAQFFGTCAAFRTDVDPRPAMLPRAGQPRMCSGCTLPELLGQTRLAEAIRRANRRGGRVDRLVPSGRIFGRPYRRSANLHPEVSTPLVGGRWIDLRAPVAE